jgi:hypothetical protein
MRSIVVVLVIVLRGSFVLYEVEGGWLKKAVKTITKPIERAVKQVVKPTEKMVNEVTKPAVKIVNKSAHQG